ncbi:MAG: hypothetical protein APF84_15790 [Gracilibacter sp. BRH_c7a]|nr:MAG: hypothetical protein APF84_15790 [Gracilibacter sp. BRH_c7a]
MKITVLNGSPKGEESGTVYFVKYIQQKNPQHEYEYFNVAQAIKKIENDPQEFDRIIESVKNSDGVIWSFPLYVYLVHSGYKRFIELIWEREAEDVFRDKYAVSVATSIHFFDHTAINYMHSICDDLNMRYIDFFSADMSDLTKENQRKKLLLFAQNFFEQMEQKRITIKAYQPIIDNTKEYIPTEIKAPLNTKGQSMVIVTDSMDQDKNIGRMVKQFQEFTQADLVDLSSIKINGGCTGCISCGFDNECMYGEKDDIKKTYQKLKKYDILVFAGTIRDRFLSARWKTFIDRRFFITHQPHFSGKQIAYLISGPLSQIHNLREVLQANAELDETNLVSILTDESASSSEIDERMEALAQNLIECSLQGYIRPQTFLGIGGMKIFRDDIWGRLRMVFQSDHRYYKKHGKYDFPQKDIGTRVLNAIMIPLTKIPSVKKSIQRDMKKHMISANQEILRKK